MNDNLNYYISIYFKDYLPKVIGVSKIHYYLIEIHS